MGVIGNLRGAISRDRGDMFYAGWEAGKRSTVPDEAEVLEFLYRYTTPEGKLRTQMTSFAGDLIEWMEHRLLEDD